MRDSKVSTTTFLNRRDWSSYVVALQAAASHPKLVDAVKSGRAWFSEGATQASHWLAGTEPLRTQVSLG